MKLSKLELENFHRFERFSITFDDQLTVLVGENGTGKSSLLAAARTALAAFFAGIDGAPASGIVESDARFITYENAGVFDRQAQYPVRISASGVLMGEKVAWARSLNSPKGRTTRSDSKDVTKIARDCSKRVMSGDTTLVLPLISYYGTGRLWAKKQHQNNDVRPFTRLDGYAGALDAETDDYLLLSWFKKMTIQELQRARQAGDGVGEIASFSVVKQAIEQCFSLISGIEDAQVDFDFDANDLLVVYRTPEGEVQSLPLGYFSDGYRTTLSMVADIAYRMALLNPGLADAVVKETPGVVLIDEVDLHLHPLWQARILGDLRAIFPKIQFIVTTHAPVVISSVRASHIRKLSVDSEEPITPQGEIYGGDLGRILGDLMDAQERPEDVRNMFDEFYSKLDAGSFAAAEEVLQKLVDTIGEDDSDVVAAQTALLLERDTL